MSTDRVRPLPGTLDVFYPPAFISARAGSSVSLSCEIRYDFQQCGLLHAAWRKSSPDVSELNDPVRFFTAVNESDFGANQRRRQVLTRILEVTAEDAGRFQCFAECPAETAMGHFITVRVDG
ncbi:unnamed protein product [Ophioblennius macclurei]